MEMLHSLGGWGWVLVGLAAASVGLSKSGIPGVGILSVVLFAQALPGQTRLAVGVLLPVLIAGDILALLRYRRHAEWHDLLSLIPSVAVGMIAAWLLLPHLPEAVFRPMLGALILVLIGMEWIRGLGREPAPVRNPVFRSGIGFGAGFTTTVGNAAGPIMSVYLVSRGLPKHAFLGTAAWFFFCVNVAKLPIYASVGMLTGPSLLLSLSLVPLVALGSGLGILLLPHIPQHWFDRTVLALAALAAVHLLV
jgi:uncharacterized protein